ncbi:MAG: hypothetical protein NZM43_05945 [Saprospiraceae bacterium]|nr:hypothetical protein [Saprospiraceae bacterium]MDW8483851.1 hypothetical protein [Saprospiraceae bacterium]
MVVFRLFVLLWAAAAWVRGQSLSSAHTRWLNSFVEWELYAFAPDTSISEEEEEVEAPREVIFGDLKLRWLVLREDWTEWEFTTPDDRGIIRMKWKGDPTQWELRTYTGAVVTMRALWPEDLTEWRVTDNEVTLTLRSRWKNMFDEWRVEDPAQGTFYMQTFYEGDPRDWAIDDRLHPSVSIPVKVALTFLVLFHSSPRI